MKNKLIIGGFILLLSLMTALYFSLNKSVKQQPEVTTNLSIKEQLMDCLPKSDMGSKEKCENLLKTINSFEGCVSAGFSIMKSNPEKCQTPDGRTFIAYRQKINLEGEFICLPYIQNPGPVDDLCRFGISTIEGNFALTANLLEKNISNKIGDQIIISGYVTPIEEISSDVWKKYSVKGIIDLTQINKKDP